MERTAGDRRCLVARQQAGRRGNRSLGRLGQSESHVSLEFHQAAEEPRQFGAGRLLDVLRDLVKICHRGRLFGVK